MRKGWGRCCLRLQPSDYYFGTRGGALLVLLVRLPGLAGFGAQTIAVDQVAAGQPGNLTIAPKLQLDQIALGGASEGGKLLVGLDLGVEVAACVELAAAHIVDIAWLLERHLVGKCFKQSGVLYSRSLAAK